MQYNYWLAKNRQNTNTIRIYSWYQVIQGIFHQGNRGNGILSIRTTLWTLYSGHTIWPTNRSKCHIYASTISTRFLSREMEFFGTIHVTKKQKLYINKLKIIELFEVDFNSVHTFILGCKLLYYREEHGINSTQTHGFRPGRATHDALNITKLTYYISRLDRITMLSSFNVAAGWYDKMIHNLITITTTRMGCPMDTALCHARVLNQMKHFIQTSSGISKAFIQSYASLNIWWCGQVYGGWTVSWISHMEPILVAYSKMSGGLCFEDPTQVLKFIQWIVGYVDDNSLILTFR